MEINVWGKKTRRSGNPRKETRGPTRPLYLAAWDHSFPSLESFFVSFSIPTLRLDLKTVNIYPFSLI